MNNLDKFYYLSVSLIAFDVAFYQSLINLFLAIGLLTLLHIWHTKLKGGSLIMNQGKLFVTIVTCITATIIVIYYVFSI